MSLGIPMQILMFDQTNVGAWILRFLTQYDSWINRAKNVQAHYCDKVQAKYDKHLPSESDNDVRMKSFFLTPWWIRFHGLYQVLMLDYNNIVSVLLSTGIQMDPFHPLRNGSIIPVISDGVYGYDFCSHSFRRALSTAQIRKLLSSYFSL